MSEKNTNKNINKKIKKCWQQWIDMLNYQLSLIKKAKKNISKKIKKSVDFKKIIWYITYALQKSAKWSFKTKQNVNYIKSGN